MSTDRENSQAVEEKIENNSNDKPSMLSVFKWRIYIGIILSALLAWIPFFGYSYQVAKLEQVGFYGVDINPKTYDLVGFFLDGVSGGILKILSIEFFDLLKAMSGQALLFSVVGVAAVFYTGYVIRYVKSRKEIKKSPIIFWLKNSIVRSNSIHGAARLFLWSTPAFFISILLVYIAMASIFIFFSGVFWLLGVMGEIKGSQAGREILSKHICQEFKWDEQESDIQHVVGCNEVVVKDEKNEKETLKGRRLYSDSFSTYFITSDAIYQINGMGEVVFSGSIHQRPNLENKNPVIKKDKS